MYCYFSLEYYDKNNGIRGGGGLGVLAADTRRVAEQIKLPFVTITPFYTSEYHQKMDNGDLVDEKISVDYKKFGFTQIGTTSIKCNDDICDLSILQKKCDSTTILAITEPNFGSLYQDTSGSDHRLYQEVALGFGGYNALKMASDTPAIVQLNEVVTVFAALSWIDDLIQNGLDFYEAVALVRKHTIYTNHTLVQAAEAEFNLDQFERYVFSNLKSPKVIWWLKTMFKDDHIKLSSIAFEVAGKYNCVSKLHAEVADYTTVSGEKPVFKAITNGIDLKKWVMPATLELYQKAGIIDQNLNINNLKNISLIKAKQIKNLKSCGRNVLNEILKMYPDQNGTILHFSDNDFLFDFKRRFVDYKRPEMPFTNLARLRETLEPRGAHYILTGRIHSGDSAMVKKLSDILSTVKNDEYLASHVHYLSDYDEKLAYGLSVGSNVAINLPVVGKEACGTSWMKDVANLNLLISTMDGGVADVSDKYCFAVAGKDFDEELEKLYKWMGLSISIWDNDSDLELRIANQLYGYLPIISGQRMLRDYLDFISRV